jgi:hypothetical protein
VWWLPDPAEHATALGAIAAQIAALEQFAAEIDGRLAALGVGGLAGALEVHRRLRLVLDAIPDGELERMAGRVQAMIAALGELERALGALRELKRLLPPEPPRPA